MDDQNAQSNPLPANPPVENPVPQAVIPPPSKFFLSTKIILLIVTVLIIMGAGGTYLTLNSKPKPLPIVSKTNPTPTPIASSTSNLKTYTNLSLGISISYPENYKVIEESGQVYIVSPAISLNKIHNEIPTNELELIIYQHELLKNYQGTLDDYWGILKTNEDYGSYSIIKKVAINGTEALYMQVKYAQGGESYTFIHNKNVLGLNKIPLTTSKQSDFDQMLSTFKFTQ